jgi:hypothetical protein
MFVAILLAYLNRLGRREHFRDVFRCCWLPRAV